MFYLVQVGKNWFVMRNAKKPLTNRQCNSQLFVNKDDARKDISVFDYFGVPFRIVSKLDMRTWKAKELVRLHGYFSASKLPEIRETYLRLTLKNRCYDKF